MGKFRNMAAPLNQFCKELFSIIWKHENMNTSLIPQKMREKLKTFYE